MSSVAEHKAQLVERVSIININHIALLFVDSEFQRHGIGKRSIYYGIRTCLEKHPGLTAVTVGSTPNSISFCERLGFVKIDEEKDEHGMRFVRMQKEVAIQ